jgi:hypothetical protein
MKGVRFEKQGDIVYAESDTFVYERLGEARTISFRKDISEDDKSYINSVIEKLEKIFEDG